MQSDTCLAFDLGAESGRAITGRLSHDRLEIAEVARFPNAPLHVGTSLRWNVPALWSAMTQALSAAAPPGRLASIAVDGWGCDYALIGADGLLVEPPYHYRDRRTDHAMADVFARVPAASIHGITGCQFLPFNTLFQLDVAHRTTPDLLDRATALVTIPDLFNYWLTGRIVSGSTIATTTQLIDPRTRQWATGLVDALQLPGRLLAPLIEPGTVLGPVQATVGERVGTPVVAPACHDTGSAVAAIEATGGTAFLSSGTWSLLGTERPAPIITSRVYALNFTNEGGVGGTTRLLKNIAGLWLLQGCRRAWSSTGLDVSYADLLQSAETVPAFAALVDPDDSAFLTPGDMPAAIDDYCIGTRQPRPTTQGTYARAILESLAFKYRVVVEWLEELTGTPVTTIRVIGGGARNRLLNQFTADATGRTVLAGPVEATALGNIALQMVALGMVGSIAGARALIARSFPVERFDPIAARRWDREYPGSGNWWSAIVPDMSTELTFLQDLWEEPEAAARAGDPLELLRYRSNVLGADLRITNFGGGNTSGKFELVDPLTGRPERVMAVKGSGGDLRSIGAAGFAVLSLDKLERLLDRYRGEAHEDEMVALYTLCAFGDNRVAASIDTPLHAFLPFPHVDHLHPDWAIALAASANGRTKLAAFNATFGRRIAWVPWQRPGFELALMLRRAVAEHPDCDGIVLGGHGLFTWGETPRECYLSSIRTIDQMGRFIDEHRKRTPRPEFGGVAVESGAPGASQVEALLPYLRGAVSTNRRTVAHVDSAPAALAFANSHWAEALCQLGTSCPDHFLRTRICPLFVPATAGEGLETLRVRIDERLVAYREAYGEYYRAHALTDSPALRDANPSVVVIPGFGVFGFAKDKREARITTEFFVNAINVMSGANALDDGTPDQPVPQGRTPEQSDEFQSVHNYVALPRSEAFRIEYWALEEAKLQRMPPDKEFSRRVALVVGAGSGIGREVALQIARRGGHVVVADLVGDSATSVAREAAALSSAEMVLATRLDLTSRESIRAAIAATVARFGGLDIVVNTAAIYPTPLPGTPIESVWAQALAINVSSNHVLAEEAGTVLKAQRLPASIVLTSSANAVVPKHGSEPYDVSKAAINHLIRELAVGLGPHVRVNGIAPATVVAGSAMFPRDRVIASLGKYKIAFAPDESTESLRDTLATFYAQRTITKRPIRPIDCAHAICFLAGDVSGRTTGHVIPVDGGLPEAFLR